ncbi:hypothetical protein BZA77DRAFT_327045 [Pyronema omphalodes]|nr:hypothetical protein BZA77DRAFT_327045 [Pyronema omphalodes]
MHSTIEKPRLLFTFGPTQDSFFISSGTSMSWNNLPPELDYILRTRASEVVSLSLGEKGSFYCRYISKHSRNEYTVSAALPTTLSFLLKSWFSNPYERPHISLGPHGSYFFQTAAISTWENLPNRLEKLLNELREEPEVALHPKSLSLGAGDEFVFLTGEQGEIPLWDGVDEELSHRLNAENDGDRCASVSLSMVTKGDYFVVFEDGSVFYSVPESVVPVVERVMAVYHKALTTYEAKLAAEERAYNYELESTVSESEIGSPIMNGSLDLPDGILGWDEEIIRRFVEKAVKGKGSPRDAVYIDSWSRRDHEYNGTQFVGQSEVDLTGMEGRGLGLVARGFRN